MAPAGFFLRGILPLVYAGKAIHGPCRLFLRGILPGDSFCHRPIFRRTCSPRVGVRLASLRQDRLRRHTIENPPQARAARAMAEVEGSGTTLMVPVAGLNVAD